jgi:hypothetical protein
MNDERRSDEVEPGVESGSGLEASEKKPEVLASAVKSTAGQSDGGDALQEPVDTEDRKPDLVESTGASMAAGKPQKNWWTGICQGFSWFTVEFPKWLLSLFFQLVVILFAAVLLGAMAWPYFALPGKTPMWLIVTVLLLWNCLYQAAVARYVLPGGRRLIVTVWQLSKKSETLE